MTAWHGDPELKERTVAKMRQHRADDAFVQGVYQQLDVDLPLGYRGCAIGCLLDKQEDGSPRSEAVSSIGWHDEVQRQFGIPAAVAGIIDDLFEYFVTGPDHHPRASDFAVAVIEAIPVGADLSAIDAAYDNWEDAYVAPYDPARSDESCRIEEDTRAAKLIEMIANAPAAAVSDAG